MKKFYLLVFLFTLGKVYSQKLIVTPDGLRDSLNIEKSYVVIEVKGKTKKQLYNLLTEFVNKKYNNSEKQMSSIPIDGEFFSFMTEIPVFPLFKGIKMMKQSIEYDTELSFKDGYIKYEIKKLHMYTSDALHFNEQEIIIKAKSWRDIAIYNKSNKLTSNVTKDNLEVHFNGIINEIKEYVKENENINKW
jgi:hypothetical protein